MSPRTPEQSEKIREERREQILQAALEVFAEKGYHNARVSDVAARAGVSQGTIYWYFKSKEELFEAAFMGRINTMFEPIVQLLQQQLPPQAKLLAGIEASLDLMVQDIELFYLLLQAISIPEVARLLAYDFQKFYQEMIEMVASLLRDLDDPDPRATASLLIAVLDGLGFQYMINPELFDRDRVLAQIREKFHLEEETR